MMTVHCIRWAIGKYNCFQFCITTSEIDYLENMNVKICKMLTSGMLHFQCF